MSTVTGSSAAPAAIGEKPAHDLQLRRRAGRRRRRQRRVDGERHDVGRGEQRGTRRPPAAASGAALRRSATTNADQAEDADEQRRPDARGRGAVARPGDQRRTSARRGRRRRAPRPGRRGRAPPRGRELSGTWRSGDEHDDRGQRQVEQEHPAPARRVCTSQPPSERPDRRRDAAEAGPRADGAGPVVAAGTTPGGWPGCPGSAARRRRPAGRGRATSTQQVRGEPAEQRRQREPDHADEEDPPPPERSPSDPPSRISAARVSV